MIVQNTHSTTFRAANLLGKTLKPVTFGIPFTLTCALTYADYVIIFNRPDGRCLPTAIARAADRDKLNRIPRDAAGYPMLQQDEDVEMELQAGVSLVPP